MRQQSSDKMCILQLAPHLFGGGAERQLSYLAPALTQRGHEVHVAYLHGSGNPEMQDRGVRLHRLKAVNNYDPRTLLQLVRLIKKIRPHLMQSWLLQSDALAAVATVVTGIPWIMREASTPSLEAHRGLKFRLRKKLVRWSDGIIANSHTGISYWTRHYPSKPVQVIRNGFPVDMIESCPAEPDRLPAPVRNREYLLYVGRFSPEKNVETLLASMQDIPTGHQLVLCGSGPLEETFRQQIRQQRLEERVVMLGSVTKGDVWTLMKHAAAIVLISHLEGFSNVILEAMLCRCPLLVSDIPPHREFLDESSALFVNKDDPNSIVRAVRHVLNTHQANAARLEKAYQVARQLSVEQMAEAYETFYKKLLEAAPGSTPQVQ